MDIHDIARELLEGVGPTLTQSMTGVSDRGAPAQWGKPTGPTPDAIVEQRLRLAHRVWLALRQTQGPNVALAWLVGSNPRLADATPVTSIRELQAADVLGAAEAFVTDTPAT